MKMKVFEKLENMKPETENIRGLNYGGRQLYDRLSD
jgi:hypothetical protein